ncbi:MAG TPA: hypothetical protein VFS56_00305 [Gemmatimonadaceae bacterium]|nr:hypothetical protein [Gemmatimonadaceae bacterium]
MIQLPRTSSTYVGRFFAPAIAALLLSAGVANAQRRPVPIKSGTEQTAQSRRDQSVPPGYAPPAGMCRIWIRGVPPGQQPAPTDCASAVRNRPANGKVLFGDEPKKAKKAKSNKKSAASNVVDLITRGMSR